MNKNMLLAATAVSALTAGSALAASHPSPGAEAKVGPVHVPVGTLYFQNNPNGSANTSQNFTSGSFGTIYNSSGADDFVVPPGHKWIIKTIGVSGVYPNCESDCDPTSQTVTFYNNKHGLPGAIRAKGTASYTLNCTDTSGNFSCSIPGPKGKGLYLTGGTAGTDYWVSVVVNMNFQTEGQWQWYATNGGGNNPGVWQNPGNGFGTGCTTWADKGTCLGGTNEWAFDVVGVDILCCRGTGLHAHRTGFESLATPATVQGGIDAGYCSDGRARGAHRATNVSPHVAAHCVKHRAATVF